VNYTCVRAERLIPTLEVMQLVVPIDLFWSGSSLIIT